MRRVFYFSGNRMKIYEWKGRELLGSLKFKEDSTGFEEFELFLKSAPLKTSQLLVDVIEEDFRREKIPHVNSRDRKALVSRLLDRHYRDEIHHQVRMISRSKSGRKDDQILMSALSNFEQLDPWLARMNEHQVPLAGIWSAPLLVEDLLKVFKAKPENLLIVSRQLPYFQRETFFKNGRLMFSRLEKLDINLRDAGSALESVDCLKQGTEQIRHFLTNQRIMGFVEKLHVICLISDHQLEECKALCGEEGLQEYEFVGLNSLYESQKNTGCEGEAADALIASLCANKSVINDHYGTRKHKNSFYRFAIDRSINTMSGLAAMLFITAAIFLWLGGIDIQQQAIAAQDGITILQRRFYQEFGESEHKLDDAPKIQAIVNYSKLLLRESEQTPQGYFSALGSVYSQEKFLPVILTEFEWVKHPRDTVKETVRNSLGKRADIEEEYDEYEEAYEEEYIEDSGIGAKTRLQAVVKLVGKLDRSELSYRETVLVMREFVDALLALKQVEEIHLVSTPVDIRPEARFSDKGGQDQDSYARNDNADAYELLLVMEGGIYD